jgi:hypothetical protein
MAKTIVDKASELIKTEGYENAVLFYQKRLENIGFPKNMQEVFDVAANEAMIEYINVRALTDNCL